MKIDKELMERTIYIILIVNIFVTLMVSSLVLSLRGSERNLIFFVENDQEFVLAVVLGFIIFYPLFFFVIYLVTFIIQVIFRIIR
ncbi:hypothetical protein J4406_00660 [Candidatus Woesearchaeota archaeon]|nr:hypothetical protein [Candidatus Woesearchaeota archaeon]